MKKIVFGIAVICFIAVFFSCLQFQPAEIRKHFQFVSCIQSETTGPQSTSPEFINNLNAVGNRDFLLNNPDRGFRGEIYITLGNLKAYPGGESEAFSSLNHEIEKFKEDRIKLFQCYVYLSEFWNHNISDEAFKQLKEYLTILEQAEMRILLRFAYDYNPSVKSGTSTNQLMKHLGQISQFIEEEEELFNHTVYAVQLGMIGLWGEGHGESRPINLSKVIPKFFQIIPQDIFIQVRLPRFLQYVPREQLNRVSLHDDFIVGVSHPWGMIPFDHPQYKDMLNQNYFAPADGEMPWGRDKTIDLIDPLKVLKQINNYQLTSLSLAHNYIEQDGGIHPYVLEKAKSIFLNRIDLNKLQLPFNPIFLENDKISMFEYLQYHLGYQLAAGNFKYVISGGKGQASLVLFNFGLAAPHEFEIQIKVNDVLQSNPVFNMHHLGKNGSIQLQIDCQSGDQIALRLVHRRNPNLTIRLANDLKVVDGWHLLPIF